MSRRKKGFANLCRNVFLEVQCSNIFWGVFLVMHFTMPKNDPKLKKIYFSRI